MIINFNIFLKVLKKARLIIGIFFFQIINYLSWSFVLLIFTHILDEIWNAMLGYMLCKMQCQFTTDFVCRINSCQLLKSLPSFLDVPFFFVLITPSDEIWEIHFLIRNHHGIKEGCNKIMFFLIKVLGGASWQVAWWCILGYLEYSTGVCLSFTSCSPFGDLMICLLLKCDSSHFFSYSVLVWMLARNFHLFGLWNQCGNLNTLKSCRVMLICHPGRLRDLSQFPFDNY